MKANYHIYVNIIVKNGYVSKINVLAILSERCRATLGGYNDCARTFVFYGNSQQSWLKWQ